MTKTNNNGHFPKSDLPTVGLPKVAVTGCGRWGRNLIRNFYNLERLYGVCDINQENLNNIESQYEGVKTSTSLETFLKDPAVSGIVIATPSTTHYQLAKQALDAGKHVYVEKPMATNTVDAQDLFSLAAQKGKILMVGHLLLYHPVINRLKQLIEEGDLGEIRFIQSDRLNFNPFRPDKSVLWDLAPHDLSMICYLLQREPEALLSVNGHRTDNDDLVDIVHLELKFPDGITGHIHNSWVHPTKHVKLVVRGSKKTAIIDDTLAQGKLQIFARDNENKPIQEYPEYLTVEPLKLECQHFINAVESGKLPRTDGFNGYNVVRILEMADKMMHDSLNLV